MIGREQGLYSHKPEEGRQVTLFEFETLVALKRDASIELGPEEHRRNVTVEGVPLTHLVGRRFWLGETLLEATRLSIPCRHIEEITGKAIFDPLINRSGLNCKILKGGIVRTGDAVRNFHDGGSDHDGHDGRRGNRGRRAGVKLFSLVDPDRWELPPFAPVRISICICPAGWFEPIRCATTPPTTGAIAWP